MTCPTSWSRAHNDYGYKNFHIEPEHLEGEEKETFELLEAWGEHMKKGLRKFHCNEIIHAETDSTEALKALLDSWHAYDLKEDFLVAWREAAAEELAKKKAGKRRKRGMGEGSQTSVSEPEAKSSKLSSEDLRLLADPGPYIPSAEEVAAVRRVARCVDRLAEHFAKEHGGASLVEFLKENDELRAKTSSLNIVETTLAAAQGTLASEPFEKATRVAALLNEAQKLEYGARTTEVPLASEGSA